MSGRECGRAPGDLIAYVGCRTTRERDGTGDGISVYHIEAKTGVWSRMQLLDGIVNPSFLAFDRERRFLYTVHADLDEVSAFRIDPATGQLAWLNTEKCGGPNPVHLTVDTTNRHLVTANYANGTVGVLPLASDGRLGRMTHCLALEGQTGTHKTHQAGLYPHHIPHDPAERFFIVPDKGGDQVVVLRLDAASGRVALHSTVKTRAGSGPRHMAFHPGRRFAYLACELDSTIVTYSWDSDVGVLTPLQRLPTCPETFTDYNTTAEIEVSPSGGHVYISNRGHDSIAIYAVDPQMGFLQPQGWQATGGRKPRFFALDPSGQRLYAANEQSHTIAAFDVEPSSGGLTPTGRVIETPSPTCIVFKPA